MPAEGGTTAASPRVGHDERPPGSGRKPGHEGAAAARGLRESRVKRGQRCDCGPGPPCHSPSRWLHSWPSRYPWRSSWHPGRPGTSSPKRPPGTSRLENWHLAQHVERARFVLDLQAEGLATIARGYPFRDEMRNFAFDPMPRFIVDNFSAISVLDAGLDLVAVLGPSGEALVARSATEDRSGLRDATPAEVAAVGPGSAYAGPGREGKHGLGSVAGSLIPLSSLPVLGNGGIGAPAGHLVFGKRLDHETLRASGERLGVEFRLLPLPDADVPEEARTTPAADPAYTCVPPDQLSLDADMPEDARIRGCGRAAGDVEPTLELAEVSVDPDLIREQRDFVQEQIREYTFSTALSIEGVVFSTPALFAIVSCVLDRVILARVYCLSLGAAVSCRTRTSPSTSPRKGGRAHGDRRERELGPAVAAPGAGDEPAGADHESEWRLRGRLRTPSARRDRREAYPPASWRAGLPGPRNQREGLPRAPARDVGRPVRGAEGHAGGNAPGPLPGS